jgi:hypothetical protein
MQGNQIVFFIILQVIMFILIYVSVTYNLECKQTQIKPINIPEKPKEKPVVVNNNNENIIKKNNTKELNTNNIPKLKNGFFFI